MKNIELARLELRNFKGIKSLDINFNEITNIRGDNATGKTTIFDAFTWLMFGKDSKDRSTFEIKTLDSNNEPLHGLEHSVVGILRIDGKPWTLKKVYKEKWTKRRGDTAKDLTGHETLFEINEVPVSQTEYKNKINDFLNEDLFKLITNPLFFSLNTEWKKRREILLKILGDITDEQVIAYKTDLAPLRSHLEDKTIDELLIQTKSTKRKLNDEIKAIPTRIDEASRSIKELDFESLKAMKKVQLRRLDQVQESLSNGSSSDERKLKIKSDIYDLKNKLRDFEYNYTVNSGKEKKEAERELKAKELEREQLNYQRGQAGQKIARAEVEKSNFEKNLVILREKYIARNKEKLDIPSHILACPTCKRTFDSGDIESKKEELQANFNQEKAKYLTDIQTDAKRTQEKIDTANHLIVELNLQTAEHEKQSNILFQQIVELDSKLSEMVIVPFTEIPEYISMEEELNKLETSYLADDGEQARKELKDRELELKSEISNLEAQLAQEQHNKELRARVQELEKELQETSQRYADAEGIEYLCEQFIKTKVELLESSINGKFSNVSFKLFSTQVNGGITETCEALIDGVPFGNANSAAQINGGLDIINSLGDYYQVSGPIFLDNRESVTRIIPTKSQIINLFVDENEKTLRVEE